MIREIKMNDKRDLEIRKVLVAYYKNKIAIESLAINTVTLIERYNVAKKEVETVYLVRFFNQGKKQELELYPMEMRKLKADYYIARQNHELLEVIETEDEFYHVYADYDNQCLKVVDFLIFDKELVSSEKTLEYSEWFMESKKSEKVFIVKKVNSLKCIVKRIKTQQFKLINISPSEYLAYKEVTKKMGSILSDCLPHENIPKDASLTLSVYSEKVVNAMVERGFVLF